MRCHYMILENISIDEFLLSCKNMIFCLRKFLFVIK